jgi:hypothetical protein
LEKEELVFEKSQKLNKGGYGVVYLKELRGKLFAQKVISGIKGMKEVLTGLKEIENHQRMKKIGSKYFLEIFAVGFEQSRASLTI